MVLRPKKLSGRKINSPPHYHVYSRMKEVSLPLPNAITITEIGRKGGRFLLHYNHPSREEDQFLMFLEG